MSLDVRRIVTGFGEDGKAIILHDGPSPHVIATSPEVTVTNLWVTDEFPLPNNNEEDLGGVKVPREPPARHSIFRMVQFDPGNKRDMHTTKSIDFAVVVSGEIDLEVDDGVLVHMKQGDTLVQQATIHGWQNKGTEPCVMAFILMSTDG